MHGVTSSPLYPAFKALIDVLCFPVELLDGRGRVGGVVALGLGVGFLAGGWWVTATVSLLGLGISGLGLAYCAYGLSRLAGKEARLRREFGDVDAKVPDRMSREELKAVLKTRAVPFFVCTRCRIAMEPGECGGQCLRCGSETDCLRVGDQADRKMVWASVY